MAKGSGVTVDYIMKKGSSCIEARKSKESDAQADIRALANNLASSSVYQPTPNRVVPAPPSKGSKSKEIRVHANRSGATTWDPLLGYPTDDCFEGEGDIGSAEL